MHIERHGTVDAEVMVKGVVEHSDFSMCFGGSLIF